MSEQISTETYTGIDRRRRRPPLTLVAPLRPDRFSGSVVSSVRSIVEPAHTSELSSAIVTIADAFWADNGLSNGQPSRLYRVLSRTIDVVVSAVLLTALLPVIGVLILLIRANSPGRAIFRQVRIGRAGQPFYCYKLRTMVADADLKLSEVLAADPALAREWEESQKLRDDPRISKIGRILRKTSLDELPQLFNVLVGQMSLVGPRPVVPAETARYGEDLSSVLQVRPGMTGLWQVSGRSESTYDERVRLDLQYVENPSVWSDLRIACKTALVLVPSKGNGAH